MVFVEQEHEDAPAAGIGGGQYRRRRVGRRRAASHVRDEIELLNGLPLAVLEHLEVFSGQAGHESSLFVEHDDVDFNEVRRGAERGLRRRWSGLRLRAGLSRRRRDVRRDSEARYRDRTCNSHWKWKLQTDSLAESLSGRPKVLKAIGEAQTEPPLAVKPGPKAALEGAVVAGTVWAHLHHPNP